MWCVLCVWVWGCVFVCGVREEGVGVVCVSEWVGEREWCVRE